jgi:hypothetical protein
LPPSPALAPNLKEVLPEAAMQLELSWEGRKAFAQDAAQPWIRGAALWLTWLNALDAAFTWAWLSSGLAEEANPLMRWAYDVSPWMFLALKAGLVQGGILLLCRTAKGRPLVGALAGSAAVYAMVVGYHLSFLARLVLD